MARRRPKSSLKKSIDYYVAHYNTPELTELIVQTGLPGERMLGKKIEYKRKYIDRRSALRNLTRYILEAIRKRGQG